MTDRITILSTTDIHGYFSATQQDENGIFSLPALSKNFHQPIFIDNGDFFIGSPMSTYFNTTYEISPLVKVANWIGYDVMIPGNHDLDYGIDFLKRQVAELEAQYLCANLYSLDDQLLFKPYTVLERNHCKIGVIGVITSAISQISSYQTTRDYKVLDVMETLAHWVPIVQQEADIVIVSYHGGIERDIHTGLPTQYDTGEDQAYALMEQISGIDGVVCGHQHRFMKGNRHNTAIVQPGYRANYIGVLEFDYDREKSIIEDKKAELVATQSYVPSFPDFIDQWMRDYQNWLEEELDLSLFSQFLLEKTGYSYQQVKLKGATIADFQASFQAPYMISRYHVSYEEVRNILHSHTITGLSLVDDHVLPMKEDYQIITNTKHFPKYRLEYHYIDNIFDDYLMYMKKHRGGGA